MSLANNSTNSDPYLEILLAKIKAIKYSLGIVTFLLFLIIFSPKTLYLSPFLPKNVQKTEIPVKINTDVVNGIHQPTGLKYDQGYLMVAAQCGSCHSLKLVTQNRNTKEGWKSIIRWMQETQNLKDLGNQEDSILAYLAKNYAPENIGRRASLKNTTWYELED